MVGTESDPWPLTSSPSDRPSNSSSMGPIIMLSALATKWRAVSVAKPAEIVNRAFPRPVSSVIEPLTSLPVCTSNNDTGSGSGSSGLVKVPL